MPSDRLWNKLHRRIVQGYFALTGHRLMWPAVTPFSAGEFFSGNQPLVRTPAGWEPCENTGMLLACTSNRQWEWMTYIFLTVVAVFVLWGTLRCKIHNTLRTMTNTVNAPVLYYVFDCSSALVMSYHDQYYFFTSSCAKSLMVALTLHGHGGPWMNDLTCSSPGALWNAKHAVPDTAVWCDCKRELGRNQEGIASCTGRWGWANGCESLDGWMPGGKGTPYIS